MIGKSSPHHQEEVRALAVGHAIAALLE